MPKSSIVQGSTLSRRILSPFILLSLIFVFGALACDLSDLTGGSKPNVIITSPPSGSTFHESEDVAVQSVSTDAGGIIRVDLLVDGQVVRTDTAPSAQTQFTVVQTWKATQGSHTILVRAYNTQNVGSDPAAISLQVSAGTGPSPTTIPGGPATPTGLVPPTIAPVIPSITPAPGTCTNNSAFVTDVTIPDGTTINASQTFNKIWRLSNDGTCTWIVGYQFVFVSGEAMSASTVIPAPSTAPGGAADLLVPMTAPAVPGTHTGNWRMRSSGGTLFGQTVSVRITVPGAPPPPPTNTSPPVCPGPPVIASFTASPNPITAGGSTTLSWGAVSNATSATIDHGIGGVATPGSTSVSPGSTTTYTLTATGCGGTATSQVTVTVTPVVFAVTGANATVASPANFTGACPHQFNFSGTITANGAGTVTYRWERSDGSANVMQSLVFGSAGTQPSVDISWAFGGAGNSYSEWERIHVLTPNNLFSNQANITLTCP